MGLGAPGFVQCTTCPAIPRGPRCGFQFSIDMAVIMLQETDSHLQGVDLGEPIPGEPHVTLRKIRPGGSYSIEQVRTYWPRGTFLSFPSAPSFFYSSGSQNVGPSPAAVAPEKSKIQSLGPSQDLLS